jgi:hypothetical protein
VQPLLGLTGFHRLANERLFGDDMMDFKEVGQFVGFVTDGAIGEHQRILGQIAIHFQNEVSLPTFSNEIHFYPVNRRSRPGVFDVFNEDNCGFLDGWFDTKRHLGVVCHGFSTQLVD